MDADRLAVCWHRKSPRVTFDALQLFLDSVLRRFHLFEIQFALSEMSTLVVACSLLVINRALRVRVWTRQDWRVPFLICAICALKESWAGRDGSDQVPASSTNA